MRINFFACCWLLIAVSGCGRSTAPAASKQQLAKELLNSYEQQLAESEKRLLEKGRSFTDLVMRSTEPAYTPQRASQQKAMLKDYEEEQNRRESFRLIATHQSALDAAIGKELAERALRDETDLARRELKRAHLKKAESDLADAVLDAGKADAAHEKVNRINSDVLSFLGLCESARIRIDQAVVEGNKATALGISGARMSTSSFNKTREILEEAMTSLCEANALSDVEERAIKVREIYGKWNEIDQRIRSQ